MKIAAFGCGFAGLVAGTALGWVLAARHFQAAGAPGASLTGTPAAAEQRQQERPARFAAPTLAHAKDVLLRLQAMQWLAQHQHEWDEIERQTPGKVFHFATGKLDPEFVAAFGLSVAEADRLQGAIAQSLERLSDRMAAGAKVVVAPDQDSARVEVPRLADAGSPIYDELVGVFRTTLGAERMSHFNALMGERFDAELGRYGAEDLVYVIQRVVDYQGRVKIVIEEETLSLSTGQSERHRRFEYLGSTTPANSAGFPLLRKVVPAEIYERMRNR
ncbi:MAG: hypothetical protein QM691_17740 [Opitutaceae bacterium]